MFFLQLSKLETLNLDGQIGTPQKASLLCDIMQLEPNHHSKESIYTLFIIIPQLQVGKPLHTLATYLFSANF